MNDIAKTNIKAKLDKALLTEKMAVSDAARCLNCLPQYLSMIRNEKYWDKASKTSWDNVLAWINSGQTLKEYGEKHGKTCLPNSDLKPKVIISRIIKTEPLQKKEVPPAENKSHIKEPDDIAVFEETRNPFDLLIEALKSIPSNVCIRISINEKIQ